MFHHWIAWQAYCEGFKRVSDYTFDTYFMSMKPNTYNKGMYNLVINKIVGTRHEYIHCGFDI